MQIQLNINGYFDINFFYLNGNKVGEHKDKDILQGILDNLQMNEYVIGIGSHNVYDINDLTKPLYTFELSATDSVEYDFEEVEDEDE